MKTLAFYLPQFHEIPENNDAWGNGFTEWVNVKKSKALYRGHKQPKVPLNNNYYNLLDIKTMEWQAKLADEAGIYGFCCYHYWFQGKLVLEKPLKNLLKHPEVDFRYCFAWANEPWTKTWHGAGGNKEILLEQTYGEEEEWQSHYKYFRKFFLDKRYIKEENKPILVIYKLKNIPKFNQMIRYWNVCAMKDGFDGIFLISMNTRRYHVDMSRMVNASVDFEPNTTKGKLLNSSIFEKPRFLDYDAMNKVMLTTPHKKNHYRTVFVNFDDSPRRKNRAIICKNSNPKKYQKYLKEAARLSKEEDNQWLFINAWNEWGEGNYLEPDTRNRYRYLEATKNVLKES